MATGPMTLQEMIISLEAQAAHHRDQLELITRRLEELRASAAAASELAEGARGHLLETDAQVDIGTAAKPRLARMVRRALTEVAPGRPFGPNWITQEVNRRFGSRLGGPVDVHCWKHLAPEAYRSRVAELVREIEENAAKALQENGSEPLGTEGVQAQDPETRPRELEKSPAPFVHAATRAARKAMWDAYGWFVAAFREAAEKLKAGDRNAAFPAGSFPPGLPFVTA